VIYVLFGSDEFSSGEIVRGLRRRMVENDPAAELNTNDVDGRRATVGSVQAAADAMPFMSERRLVVVSGMLVRCNPQAKGGKNLSQALIDYLENVPPTTRLVFHDGPLTPRNPVLLWAEGEARNRRRAPEQRVIVRRFDAPKGGMLPGWLAKRAAASGGSIETRAAIALADALTRDGEVNLRRADSELEKLLTYAASRPVTADDVEYLVTPVSIESVFRFSDALAMRDGPTASILLHKFLEEGEHPLRMLGLVSRQLRLITRAKLSLESGTPEFDVKAALPVPPFVAQKVLNQARRYDIRILEIALHRLVEAETAIKTGRMEASAALDLFVAELCATSPRLATPRTRRSH
jgi:DNA polymerase-3 subunit delta